MRILLTRPAADAARTAVRLQALGHEPVTSPVLIVEPTGAPIPPGPFAALLVTSANTFEGMPDAAIAALRGLPAFCVGDRTAQAGRHRGFVCQSATGDAAALCALVAREVRQGAPLLYGAGEERKPALEAALTAAGYPLTVVELYRTIVARALSVEAEKALRSADLGAALHYSRRSAEIWLSLCHKAGLLEQATDMPHLCLSWDVAQAFSGLDRAHPPLCAARPDEDSLLSLLESI